MRRRQHRLEKLRQEAQTLEEEIDRIDTEMNGEAATDYVRVAELDTRKTEKEDRLLAVYEELESLEEGERNAGETF